jgi:Tol biopolymer transport system component
MWLTFADSHGQQLYSNLPKQTFTNGFLAWAPDGKRLAAVNGPGSGASSIWIVEPEGREPFKKLADLPTSVNRAQGITWTADGVAVIFGKIEANSDIVLFDVNQ